MIAARDYRTGRPIGLDVADGVISGIRRLRRDPESLPWVAPGLVDLQVNGYRGNDFTSLDSAAQAASLVARDLHSQGVTTFLPTVTTAPESAISQELRAIAGQVSQDPLAARSIPGIHLEGPFLSPEDGPRGAHSLEWVRPPDWDLFSGWQADAGGLIRLVTLAPELPGALDFIRRCVDSGVKVAIGHTAADSDTIRAAADAGATLSTHLGNGCHRMLPRHPNYLWDQLAEGRLWAAAIGDGFHLPAAVVKVISLVKGPMTILVSDMTSYSGLAPGDYPRSGGPTIRLTPEGRLSHADEPVLLAGSASTLRDCVETVAGWGFAECAKVWDMASRAPSQYMGLPARNGLAVGAPADLVLFDWDGKRLAISRTYQAGQVVCEA